MSTQHLCFEQKFEKYQNFLSKFFHFLVVKVSIYLKRCLFIMSRIGIINLKDSNIDG